MNLYGDDNNLSVTETMVLVLVGIVSLSIALGLYFAKDYRGTMSYVFLEKDGEVVPCKQYGEDPIIECDLSVLKKDQ